MVDLTIPRSLHIVWRRIRDVGDVFEQSKLSENDQGLSA